MRRDHNYLDGPNGFYHSIRKDSKNFYCKFCWSASHKDPDCSEDPMAGTLRHIENQRSAPNLTEGELRQVLME